MKKVRKTGKIDAMDPVLSRYHPGGNLGSTSESFSQALKKVRKSLSVDLMATCANLVDN